MLSKRKVNWNASNLGSAEGKGNETFASGNAYEGKFKNNKREGKGF